MLRSAITPPPITDGHTLRGPRPLLTHGAWVGNPWAVYYGGYFTPYPVYPSPAFWLTDYMISASLAADYQARMDAANGVAPQAFAAPPAPLTPDVKQAISAEVQRQIALENAEATAGRGEYAEPDPASSGVVRMLTDNTSHVFVAGADLDVIDARGQQCALSQGDVIQLNPAPLPPDAVAANLVVLASKPAGMREGQFGFRTACGFAGHAESHARNDRHRLG